MQRSARMKRELEMLSESPPHGISCWSKEDCLDQLEAQILGGEGTPYDGGVFKIEIQIPERYPFEPPKLRYVTPVYHPNIDDAGRICLDRLKMPPSGSWKPALNISAILTTLQLLMAEPNPDDPLMTDIAEEFKFNRPEFTKKAIEWTRKYAMADRQTPAGSSSCSSNVGDASNVQAFSSSTTTTQDDSTSDSDSDSDSENVTRKTGFKFTDKRRSTEMMVNAMRENVKKMKSNDMDM